MGHATTRARFRFVLWRVPHHRAAGRGGTADLRHRRASVHGRHRLSFLRGGVLPPRWQLRGLPRGRALRRGHDLRQLQRVRVRVPHERRLSSVPAPLRSQFHLPGVPGRRALRARGVLPGQQHVRATGVRTGDDLLPSRCGSPVCRQRQPVATPRAVRRRARVHGDRTRGDVHSTGFGFQQRRGHGGDHGHSGRWHRAFGRQHQRGRRRERHQYGQWRRR